jgi:hypothetical protein
VTVVSRGRAARFEIGAPDAMRREIVGVGRCAAGERDQPFDIFAKTCAIRVDDEVRTIGRQNAPAPARGADFVMRGEIVQRAVGRRDRFDVEALIERARPEIRRRESNGDGVVEPVGVVLVEPLRDAKYPFERIFEPETPCE